MPRLPGKRKSTKPTNRQTVDYAIAIAASTDTPTPGQLAVMRAALAAVGAAIKLNDSWCNLFDDLDKLTKE